MASVVKKTKTGYTPGGNKAMFSKTKMNGKTVKASSVVKKKK